ncbi:serine O-acetyltransferase [Leptospira sp. 2 VSF19]|uniref:Serine acetyltransferase n=1 Tax=Leptospira soteropolitanensis TaxID=2950025 RepID=A0AAW5VBG6_9LEPT|nr:serine O-acetyltransferase [Leptospira soteropolitanensis]MCW7491583.1 serine O-acetyltransferase [Leptospira soteropolitanensis]MCW7499167.1 serine O-acetyltransferase [Leptospira soteropolitanensis]MCW7521241.1 serine O-acetyltransferase [Leptospira soteropolitanensis]MCW7525271.1 serine O-acetyltransferase [Leptospira soteropolitanensis]MCW7529138.1 serine O-acetyltransferase [Leptospira soteropolitanensis]
MFENIKIIKKFDPAAKSYLEIVLCYPGLHALWLHKFAHLLYQLRLPIIPRLVNYISRFLTGIDIHPGAKIAPGVFIDHGSGVVIGETAIVGSGSLIFQGVTLGGTGKESGKRHPTIGKNVVIGAGAKVLGNIIVEDHVRVGAGSVVMRNVPAGCTVVGIPGKVVKAGDIASDSVEQMLEHNQMPDPIAKVFSVLLEKVETQQQLINKLYEKQQLLEKASDEAPENDRLIQEFIHGDGI